MTRQIAHLHNAARALSSPCLAKISFVIFDIVVKNKSNVVWRGMYSYRQRYASSQWSKCCGLTRLRLASPQQILTTVMTRIVVDKSTYHAKPHSIC